MRGAWRTAGGDVGWAEALRAMQTLNAERSTIAARGTRHGSCQAVAPPPSCPHLCPMLTILALGALCVAGPLPPDSTDVAATWRDGVSFAHFVGGFKERKAD